MKTLKIITVWFLIFNFSETIYAQTVSDNKSCYSFFENRIQACKDKGYDDIVAYHFALSGYTIKKFSKKIEQTKDSTRDYSIFYAISKYRLKKYNKRVINATNSNNLHGLAIYLYATGKHNQDEIVARIKYGKKMKLKDDESIYFVISDYTYQGYMLRYKYLKKALPNNWNNLGYMFAASNYNFEKKCK